jgi:hypothetical protein
MNDMNITLDGMGDMVTNLPGVLGYVPDNHLVLIVSTVADDSDRELIGPVVTIAINERLGISCAKAIAAIIASARENQRIITQVDPVVITGDHRHRDTALTFVHDRLIGLPLLPVSTVAYVENLDPGAIIHGWGDDGEYLDAVGDWTTSPTVAHKVREGGRIHATQQVWERHGGREERGAQRRQGV